MPKQHYEYEQHLSDDLEKIYFGNSELRKLIESDNELIFAVRKNEIHIYYLGGRILKITKANKMLRFSFALKYAKKKRGSDELNEYGDIIKELNANPYNIDLWIKHFGDLKRSMQYYRKNVSPNAERQLQQILELNNRDFNGEVIVVDNEYGVREVHDRSSKLCKVDLVAVYKDSGKYKICLIELKCGDDAIDGKAGISDHIKDYKKFLDKRKKDIIASVNNLIEYKRANKFLSNVPSAIELDEEDTEICVSILCYDLPDRKRDNALSAIKETGKDITFDLYYNLDMDSSYHKITRKDILANKFKAD